MLNSFSTKPFQTPWGQAMSGHTHMLWFPCEHLLTRGNFFSQCSICGPPPQSNLHAQPQEHWQCLGCPSCLASPGPHQGLL